MVDIAKGIRGLFGGEKKALGLPYPNWQLVNGMWVQWADNHEKYVGAYKSLSYIYSIIKTISDKSSDAPWQVMTETNSRAAKGYKAASAGVQNSGSIRNLMRLKAQAFDDVESHPFLDLLEKPNPISTQKQLRWELAGYLLLTGNAYLYAATPGVGSNANRPVELWVIPSPCVEIVSGTRRNPVAGYKISYFTEEIIPPEKIIHIKYFNPVTDPIGGQWLYGQPPLKAARSLMGRMEAAETASGTLFKNMGPPGILSGKMVGNQGVNTFNQAQAVAIKDSFRQQHMGVHNAGDIVVTPAEVSWTSIGVSPVDLKIIEAQDNYVQEICAVFGFPKEIFLGAQNVASQGENNRRVVTNAVLPLNRLIDDAMTTGIRRWYGDDKLHVVSDNQYYPELQQDQKDLAQWLSAAWWLSVDQKLTAMDYEAIGGEEGAARLVPSGLTKLEDIVSGPEDLDVELLDREGLIGGEDDQN